MGRKTHQRVLHILHLSGQIKQMKRKEINNGGDYY